MAYGVSRIGYTRALARNELREGCRVLWFPELMIGVALGEAMLYAHAQKIKTINESCYLTSSTTMAAIGVRVALVGKCN